MTSQISSTNDPSFIVEIDDMSRIVGYPGASRVTDRESWDRALEALTARAEESDIG